MSELRVDSVKSKGGGAPDLPKGVTISGITTAATLGATTIDVSNVNVSGVVTSATLNGPLLSTGTPTLGLGVTINSSGVAISGVATAGIVSATTLYGDGTNITGVGATLAPLFYNPDLSDSLVLVGTGIGITFNSQINAGTGNITIRETNASGTVVENFGVGSSVTISENRVSFTPTAGLTTGTVYYLNYPSGCFTNNEGTDYVGTAYTFMIKPIFSQLWSWGWNNYGSLGQNNKVNYSSPTQIPGTTWRSIGNTGGIGGYTGMATKTDGTLWVWGDNEVGALGQNDLLISRSSPVQIPGTTWSDNFQSHTAGGSSAIKTDGTLWAWGYNYYGQLGQNSVVQYSSPVQIPGTTWSTAADTMDGSSEGRMFAIKTDGTLWCWGLANNGNLGLNQSHTDINGLSSPTQIPGTTWSNISISSELELATKTDGTLWAWGTQQSGKLGQNESPGSPATQGSRSSPVQIPGTTWSTGKNKIACGTSYALATKTDGTLWAWGSNSYGTLGLNQAVALKISSPTQIPGTTWSTVTASSNEVLAMKTDNTLWSWGLNHYGQIDHNDTTHRSSPTQIPGTDWTQTGNATYINYAIKQT